MDEKRRRFEAEVLPHLDAAFRFARWLSGSSNEAGDVAQEAILRAFRSFETLRGSDARAWLLAIVRNCHATAFRQAQRRAYVPLPETYEDHDGEAMIAATPDPESLSIREDEQRTLTQLLSTLPEEQRVALVLKELEDLSYRDIAAVTGVPIGTVMSRLARARAALKERAREESAGGARGLS
ncbi:MAG TPA: sigma-70 family RNA polymerase sigma factor [Steroidobacteraceae bacterium]|nr:sigma-70 family RNA polymerase sigma factor [Steroidobacteraceae bacterium]